MTLNGRSSAARVLSATDVARKISKRIVTAARAAATATNATAAAAVTVAADKQSNNYRQ